MVAALLFHAVVIAPATLQITRIDLPLPDLPPEFDGYLLAIVSDLHTGIPGSVAQARRVLQAVTEAQPDALIHLGDFGHSYKASRSASQRGYVRSMRLLDPLLRDMRARDAVLAVLGNHDYYFDAVAVRQWLEGLGIRVLVNEHHVLQRGSARLAVLGVDDAKEGGIDLARAADGLPDDLIPRILLSHNPDGVFAIEPESRLCVAISGHTHGGQVSLPWYGAPARFCRICGRRSANGWVPNDRVRLYVTKGVGGMIPFRINVPPEIVLARLRPANS